jgi:hypothetical protein
MDLPGYGLTELFPDRNYSADHYVEFLVLCFVPRKIHHGFSMKSAERIKPNYFQLISPFAFLLGALRWAFAALRWAFALRIDYSECPVTTVDYRNIRFSPAFAKIVFAERH